MAGMCRRDLPTLLMLALSACDSSALSLGDPNDINASLEPPYIADDQTTVWTLTLLDGADDGTSGDMSDNYILDADFGQGVGLSSTGYTFKSNFEIELGLTLFAEAEAGTRTFSVRFINDYGEFFAHGEFDVIRTP
jgi:hypothetical protein